MKVNSAIILAGGKSSRMGFDKQLIRINDKLIVDYIAEKLEGHFDQIVVVTNTPKLYQGKNYTLTKDVFPGYGPLAGIHAGFLSLNSQAAFVIACDMPLVDEDFLLYLKETFEDNDHLDGIISSYGDFIEPMNGVYSKSLLPNLEEALSKRELKIRSLIEKSNFLHIDESVLKNFSRDMFKNINYESDLKEIYSKKL